MSRGETELNKLLQTMQPVLQEPVYVFVSVDSDYHYDSLQPIMVFQEAEGTTLITTLQAAKAAQLNFEFACRMITLNVHSALEAVGFLSRITTELAACGMGVNPVSAFYHDHLFIPESRAQEALDCLLAMTKNA